jgi:uroporphyrinogen-III synthase
MKTRSHSAPARPLSGIRVLVGRARHQAGALSAELRTLGAEVEEIPFIEIRKPRSFRSLDRALEQIDSYDWLILTSVNGVDALWERVRHLRLTNRQFRDLQIAAIGPATKKAIEQHQLKVDVVPREYVAESVVRSLRAKLKGKRALLVRAKVARDVIPRELRRAGARVDIVEAYQTVLPKTSQRRLRSLLASPDGYPHIVTFTSSSTVRNFVALLGAKEPPALHRIQLASIGPITSATLGEFGLPVAIRAKEFTIPGLVEAIVAATRRGRKARRGAGGQKPLIARRPSVS